MPTTGRDLALAIAAAALDRKAYDVVVLDVQGILSYADYLVICSGRSDRQVRAIAEGVGRHLRDAGVRALGSEGQRSGRWVLMDFDDVIVHVFHEETRGFYGLERLWFDAPHLDPKTGETLDVVVPAAAPAP